MWSRAQSLFVLIAPLFLALVPHRTLAITRDELYTHGHGLDAQLAPDDDASSEEVHLDVPIMFYGQQYSSIYVNINGLLSFRTDIPDFLNTEFPLEYPVIAPFYSNVDTRNSGDVFYRETQDAYIIAKATEDMQNIFRDQYDFNPTSVFIATWTDVGYHALGDDKFNTFQVVIISNGNESFVEFLYPEGGIQWIQGVAQQAGLPDARAQVGFVGGDGRFFLLKGSGTDHIRSITHMSNSGTEGLFAYRVGNISDEGNIEEPENYGAAEDFKNYPTTCSTGGSHQCHFKAQCIDYQSGFCCVCLPGFYGNGKTCLKNDMPLRVNGKVSGELNGELLESLDLQAYVVMSDGRSYTAMSKVPERFGYDMQTLNVIGGVIGWLFAKPVGDAKNGYQLTGGILNHTSEILFSDSDHKVTVKQYFTGLDLFDQLRMEVEIKGSIPKIPPGTRLEISEYEEQYSSPRPGLILSRSSRSFKNRGLLIEYPFSIDQSITYDVCSYSSAENLMVDTYTLKVAKNFLGYESREHITRYGMSNKITPLGQEDPCIRGRETCGEHSACIIENDDFKCLCNPGYQYMYPQNSAPICVDINECSTGTHTCDVNAQCINQEGSFSCQCTEGFRGNGISCEKLSVCEKHRCDPNARCFELYASPVCRCNEGFTGDGTRCWPLSEAGCEVLQNCSPFATCIKSEYLGSHICQCSDGYYGDGYTCNAEYLENTTEYQEEDLFDQTTAASGQEEENTELQYPIPQCFNDACACPRSYNYDRSLNKCTPDPRLPHNTKGPSGFSLSCNAVNRCHPYAQCVYSPHTGDYQCQCTAGYEGTGIECTEQEISCDEIDVCDVHATCTYDPGTAKSICICNPGYSGDGNVCQSLADCESSADCERNAECRRDSEGSLRCVCIQGYSKDAQDACIPDGSACSGATCAEHAACKWDPDYQVNYCECESGYQGNGIDNCELLPKGCNVLNDCGSNAVCSLNPKTATYECSCKTGFYGDGHKCISESSCQYNERFCSADAACVERNNEFVCQCRPGYTGNGQTCKKTPKHEGNFLLLNQGMATMRVPFEPTSRDPGRPIHISYLQMAIGLDIDCAEGKVYWSDITGRMIKSSNYDGSSIDNFLTNEIISPEGLSVDWVSRNIFWTDSRRDTIEVANLDTKTRKVLFNTSLVDPRGIAVHPYRGKIFWSDWNRDSPKIEWANMDGSGRGVFLNGDSVHLPNSLAIDFDTDELCYADAGTKSIECVQIDSLDKRTVATNCSYPFGLTVTETRYYWTDWMTQKIEGFDRTTNQRLKPLDVPLGSGSGNKLYGIAAVPEQCRPISNSCQYDNGQCPAGNLCLLDGKGGRRCICGKSSTEPPLCYE